MAEAEQSSPSLPPVVKRMLSNFKLASSVESDNRKRGLRALKFKNGGKEQWETAIYDLWRGQNLPTDSYNQIPQFTHQVTNDLRMNMPQTRFVPGDEADKEKAEVMEDLIRSVQSSSEAEVAYDTAVESAVDIGWGGWRYVTRYENDETFDQVIDIEWIPNIFTIYDDPAASKQDRSDRRWLIQVSDVPREDVNRSYKKKYDSLDLASIGDLQPEWADESNDMMRIAEYWEVDEERESLYRNKKTGKITSDKPSDMNNYDMREVTTCRVMWYKCTATEKLEEKEWQGRFIPYVIIEGNRTIVDGKKILKGLVESLIPAQQQYNYCSNVMVKLAANAPRSPIIADPASVQGYEKYWNKANIEDRAWLPAHTYDSEGRQLMTPKRMDNSANIGTWAQLLQQAQQNFYTTSGIYPASLGQASNEKSGKAILARQREGDTSTFHFGDELARGQRFGGRIFADLAPKIYDGTREVTLVKEDKSNRRVKINGEFEDAKGNKKNYDLTSGTYEVVVTTGPSYTTRRQESAEAQMQLLQTPLGQIVANSAADLIIAGQDWPNSDKIAERVKRTMPPQITEDDADENAIPPQAAMQIQQMEQQLGMLAQQLEATQGELQSAQADNTSKMADVQNKQMDLQLKAQQMQLDADEQARADQLKGMEIELKAREITIKEKQQELDEIRFQYEIMQQPEQPAAPQGKTIDASDRNALAGQVQTLDEETAQRETANQLKAAELEQSGMTAEANLQAIGVLIGEVSALKAAIMAPKMIIRDPVTGQAQGVVTDANQA